MGIKGRRFGTRLRILIASRFGNGITPGLTADFHRRACQYNHRSRNLASDRTLADNVAGRSMGLAAGFDGHRGRPPCRGRRGTCGPSLKKEAAN